MNSFLIVVYCVCTVYMLLNFKHDIHMFQQNSYRIKRYWKYLKNGDMTSAWRLADVALLFLLFSTLIPTANLAALLIGTACLIKIFLIMKRRFKKPLVFTKRVRRLYSVTSLISVSGFLAVVLATRNGTEFYDPVKIGLGTLLAICIFSWAAVILADVILMPVEKAINRKYINQAKSILQSKPDLTVIGITGSYGKTSTKHYLERILSEDFDVLMTPGSYNTTMGVVRTVRELMKPYHQVFICEMGAKQRGDISEICDLVHPQIGIVTAVGPMHLESFKTMENIQATKFELADSLPADGLAVVNDDFEYCASRPVANVESTGYSISKTGTISAEGRDNAYVASDIKYSKSGTSFKIMGPDGFELDLHTRLVGDCNVSNLMAAVIVALKLGVRAEKIKRAVEDIRQVEHRLSMRQTAGGVIIIDDAFNSNPDGARMALKVLGELKDGKRIVVTPGMIELGEKQHELNSAFGTEIAKHADLVFVVGHYNREAIVKGLKEAGMGEDSIRLAETFNEAQIALEKILAPGDAVLYENDLPDSFK